MLKEILTRETDGAVIQDAALLLSAPSQVPQVKIDQYVFASFLRFEIENKDSRALSVRVRTKINTLGKAENEFGEWRQLELAGLNQSGERKVRFDIFLDHYFFPEAKIGQIATTYPFRKAESEFEVYAGDQLIWTSAQVYEFVWTGEVASSALQLSARESLRVESLFLFLVYSVYEALESSPAVRKLQGVRQESRAVRDASFGEGELFTEFDLSDRQQRGLKGALDRWMEALASDETKWPLDEILTASVVGTEKDWMKNECLQSLGDRANLKQILQCFEDSVVVLDFAAPWCGPCHASVPYSNDLMAELADQGLVILNLQLLNPVPERFEAERAQAIHHARNIDFPVILLEPATQELSGMRYEANGRSQLLPIPTYFYRGRDGKWAGASVGGRPVSGFIKELLNQR
jgi:thiol-disulfide isomerase/thioredoxin